MPPAAAPGGGHRVQASESALTPETTPVLPLTRSYTVISRVRATASQRPSCDHASAGASADTPAATGGTPASGP